MELVYLWVEKYKNIKHQGFNFSGRYRCDYDPEKNELTIDENKEYVHIFPKNINVTAIVGENGSGKSSILEQLMLLFYSASQKDAEDTSKSWVLIYDNETKCIAIEYFSTENIGFDKINTNDNGIKENCVGCEYKKYYFYNSKFKKRDCYNIFYNPSIELVSSFFLDYISDGLKDQYGAIYDLDFKPDTLNIYAFPSKKKGLIDIKKLENNAVLTMYKSIEVSKIKNFDFKLNQLLNNTKLNFVPQKVDFIFNLDDTEYLIKHDNQKIKEILFSNYNDLSLKSLYAYFITSIMSIANESFDTKEFEDYFFQDGSIKDYLRKNYIEQKKQIPKNDVVPPVYKLTKYLLENIEEFMTLTSNIKLADSLKENANRLNVDVVEIAKLIDAVKILNDDNILNRRLNDTKTILKVLPVIPSCIRVNAYNKDNICFNDLSYGEKNFISLVYSLIYYAHFFSHNENTINIFLDEIETGLNPKWQKKLINTFIPFFSKLNVPLNIIISSHSPFILSDLPKENVIFLKNGKQDSPFKDPEQTFGANIHMLLSHGFFMDKGLMGEFARGKITAIKDFYEKVQVGKNNIEELEQEFKENIDDFENIQKIIGEPFLKTIMGNYLDELHLIFSDEKTLIDKELIELEKRKQSLKSLKNAKN
ncbi:MAG: AAA family ATPase [Sulfuricurvum sp.]|jgi:predicted ATPase|uniref:AAA family ATPase n=1 Tax=Sulfuricurvum sp. TaxID=2025608 RepID=UPI0025DCBEC4|nr:AAA family ATPase [Sulfuricurvum sp.]MCK9373757.1 AAA family ATPase [Sulfuricurvum sp.]